MQSFLCLVVGVIIGYLVGHSKGGSQVTYNSMGHKVVVSTSDSYRNAAILAGQECGEDGFTLIGSGKEEDEAIFTIECSKKESTCNLF